MATHSTTDEAPKHTRKSQKPAAHAGSSNGHRHTAHHGRAASLLAMQDKAASTVDGIAQHLADLKEKGVRSSQALEKTIIENPKSTVVIAFGVGYILARLRRWM